MKKLACGTHLILDGFGVDPEIGVSEGRVDKFMDALPEFWPLGEGRRYRLDLENGSSAIQTGRHGYALIHFFSEQGWLVVDMFTAADADPAAAATIIERAFELSRFDLRLTRRSRLFPEGENELKRAVLGERHYAQARLTPLE
ncbi:S-adenosylmethionine decarboxylase [Oceanithermus sp.]